MNYEFDKYACTLDTLRETIDTYGVAIIPNVLNEDECSEMERGMWDTLEHWTQLWDTPIRRDKPNSWRNIKYLFPKHSMLIQQYGLGHAQFIWNLRQNMKCVEPFARLWNCQPDELLTSFDAASFHMPPETTKIGWHKNAWFHSDQSYTRNNFECVQSWVTAFDVNKYDATLAIYEGSHRYHREFAEQFNVTNTSNWYKLESDEQRNFYKDRGCTENRIMCPKGSMVFWDSRTIHCGVEPSLGRNMPNFRCVAYLCYMPRELSTKAQLNKKIKAFDEMRMTSHWPCKVKLFPKMPRTYGAEVKPIEELPSPVVNELGRKLIGY